MNGIASLWGLLPVIRTLFFAAAVVAAVVVLLDWLVRTRRVSAFGPIARFSRRVVDPLIAPVERVVVRAGGLPTSAPWWSLVAIVIAGLIVLYLLEFVLAQVMIAQRAFNAGPKGVMRLLVLWVFGFLQIALLVRVISSWVRVSPYSMWVHWSYRVTEPVLRPLRGVIPPFGMMDVTPLIAYFILVLLQRVIMGMM